MATETPRLEQKQDHRTVLLSIDDLHVWFELQAVWVRPCRLRASRGRRDV